MQLAIQTRFLVMHLLGRGRLLPWLGPALKGLTARAVKDRVCRWSVKEQARWKFCRGCPHMGGCVYGQTFEPDPPADRLVLRAARDNQRALALAPFFPVDTESRPGDRLQVRAVFVGRQAIEAAPKVIGILVDRANDFRLGSDRVAVAFEAQEPGPSWPAGEAVVGPTDLPGSVQASAGRVPWLRVELTSPLILKSSAGPHQKARMVREPGFGDLVRASLRVIGRAFAMFGDGPLEAVVDFAGLKAAAQQVRTADSAWQLFRQARHSNRSEAQYEVVGVTGGAVFTDVPAAFLPWLVWGGRLGVGEYRVAGAGCWQLTVL